MKRLTPDDDDNSDNPETYIAPTFYPQKDELERLAKNLKFNILTKRLNDKTVENIILDNMKKRDEIKKYEILPKDLLQKISLHIDIRTLMDLASKDVLFASLLTSNDFWKQKYYNDFPEVKNYTFFLTENFKSNYFVVRFWILVTRKFIFTRQEDYRLKITENVFIPMKYKKDSDELIINTEDKNGKLLCPEYKIDFNDYFSFKYKRIRKEWFECNRSNYLESYLKTLTYLEQRDPNRSSSGSIMRDGFLELLYFKGKGTVGNAFQAYFKQGYVKKEDGKPVIGHSVF